MDYLDHVRIARHASWPRFLADTRPRRLVLATTRAGTDYLDFQFHEDDILLFGRESAGVPDEVHEAADHRIAITMQPAMRSLNIAMSCAMIAGEAIRQLR